MESVEGHLGGGLSHGLSTYAANHFTWMYNTPLISGFDLTAEPIERLPRHSILLDDVLDSEHGAHVDLGEPGCILVGLVEQFTRVKSLLLVNLDAVWMVRIQQVLNRVKNVSWRQIRLASGLDVELLFCKFDQSWHVHWQVDALVVRFYDVGSQSLPIVFKLLELSIELLLNFFHVGDLIDHMLIHKLFKNVFLFGIILILFQHNVFFFHLLVVHEKEWNRHAFNEVSIHTVLSVDELKNLVPRGPHGLIILHLHILKCLDKTSLDVSSFCSFTSCIDNTLSTTHGMEVKFLWRESVEEVVGYETFAIRAIIILTVMR